MHSTYSPFNILRATNHSRNNSGNNVLDIYRPNHVKPCIQMKTKKNKCAFAVFIYQQHDGWKGSNINI